MTLTSSVSEGQSAAQIIRCRSASSDCGSVNVNCQPSLYVTAWSNDMFRGIFLLSCTNIFEQKLKYLLIALCPVFCRVLASS